LRNEFVMTHRPPETVNDPQVTFLSCNIEDAIAIARAAAGDRDVGVFGASIARQCIQAGLLDVLIVHIVPVLLGDGVRLYDTRARRR
jgi:dihydrofolate reductase